jgi:D-alanine-D-alanine ligase
MLDAWKDKRVAVLLGGLSSERTVSLSSGGAVAVALSRRGYDVVEIDAGRDLARQLLEAAADVAVIVLHGTYGEDGCVQGLLEIMGIPYTGSGVAASSLAMDKVRTKRLLQAGGLPVPADRVLSPTEALESDVHIPFDVPLVVKPAAEGSSVGTSVVTERGDLPAALADAARWGQVLVEEFVAGPEVTVAMLDGQAMPPVEIRPHDGFYDYRNKYTKGRTSYICPARISDAATGRIQEMAIRACELIGVTGVARVDFMLAGGDDPHLLEINTIPGMTELSLVPMAAREAGLSFEDVAEHMLASARCELKPAETDA